MAESHIDFRLLNVWKALRLVDSQTEVSYWYDNWNWQIETEIAPKSFEEDIERNAAYLDILIVPLCEDLVVTMKREVRLQLKPVGERETITGAWLRPLI